MTCNEARTSLSALIDCRLRESEREALAHHLGRCSDCRRKDRELRSASHALQDAVRFRPPLELTYRLRVLASHERARMIAGSNWWEVIRFRLNQILRPLAVPAAGGLLSSLLFFAVLTPGLTVHASTRNDVPAGFFTPVTLLNPSPFGFNGRDVIVEVTIDENGAVSDYTAPGVKLSKDEMRDIGNFILFTSFKAATVLGRPVSSKMLLNISHIDVRT